MEIYPENPPPEIIQAVVRNQAATTRRLHLKDMGDPDAKMVHQKTAMERARSLREKMLDHPEKREKDHPEKREKDPDWEEKTFTN